jgi:hypothetical protein
MFRRAPWLLAAVLIAGMLPSAAHAERDEGRATATALRLILFGGDTPLLGGSSGGSAAIVGGGAQLGFPFGKSRRWMIAPGGTYGLGHNSDKQTSGGSSTTFSSDIHTISAFLDWLYGSDCCDESWYCGPGFYYSSTSITDKVTGGSDVKFNGIHSYGIQLTEGGGVPIGQMVLFGGATQRIGFTSFTDKGTITEEKLHSITHSIQFQGGLKVKL